MPIARSQSVGADNAATFEEVETSATSGSDEVRELRGRLATLTDLVTQQATAAQRQEARMKWMEDLLVQQAAAREAQDTVPPTPAEVVAPRVQFPAPGSSRAVPLVVPQERVETAPPVQMPPAGAVFPTMVEGQERDRLMSRLNEFRKCNPRIFDGENVDYWIVEKWLMNMEKLFRDTFVEERDRVWLATHYLDGEAYRWWRDIQENPSTDLAAITWKRFKELILEHYFPDSVRRQMEMDLHGLRRGERPAAEGASQTHTGRPPRQSRSRGQSRGRSSPVRLGGRERSRAPSCVICGGRYYPRQCSQREGRCYLCGREGHF